jgi:hypothetical protein
MKITISYTDGTSETFSDCSAYSTGASSITFVGTCDLTGVTGTWEIPLVTIHRILRQP